MARFDDADDEEPDTKRGINWLVWIPVGMFALLILATLLDPDAIQDAREKREQREREAANERENPDRVAAWVMAQEFINRKLKAPATADYGSQNPEEVVTKIGDKAFRVVAWVDSENAFGAKIRTDFVCELHYAGNDKWELDRLDFVER